jgi:tetratricopeptide (TPR) repeat protein
MKLLKVGGFMLSDQAHQQIGQSVGAKLRAARLAKKYTQGQLARPDFSVSYISAIERGQIHPSLRALEIFALRLGISATDLLSMQASQDAKGVSAIDLTIQSEEEIELQFLEAQILIRQGAAERAIVQLRNLTSYTLTPPQELRLRYLLGWSYFSIAMLEEGESVLAEALKLTKDSSDYLSLQILNLLGKIYSSMHNYAQGLEYYQLCLHRLEGEQQPQDAFFRAQVYTNMGLNYIYLDKFDEAIQMFQRALSITRELVTTDQLSAMYWNASQQFAEAKDYYHAMLFGHKSLQLHFQRYSGSLKSEIYHYLGRAMLRGDQQRALDFLEQSLQEVSVLQDQLSLASLTTNMAEWLLMNERVAEAHEYAQRAQALASPSGDSLIAAYALIVLGQVAYAQEAYEAGDGHYMAGLEMLERLGAQEEFADQSAHYAELLENRGMVQEALTRYKKAFESRRKLD